MALVFCDGFDHYDTPDVLKKWSQANSFTPSTTDTTFQISPSWARPPGGMGMRATGSNNRYVKKSLTSTYATLIGGAYVYFESLGGSTFMSLVDSGTTQFDIRIDASGHILATRNGTLLATSTNSVAANTWYHVEMKATIHNTAGNYEVKVNGTSTGWVPAQGGTANTRATANNYANEVWLGAINGVVIRFDDFYLLDTSGSVANDFLGPQKIITIFPTAAGNSAQWTGNYAANFANVNESVGDSDSTFNQSSTANQIDLFAFDDVPSGTISGIQHVTMARQDAGAQRTMRAKTRISSTNYNGSTVNTSGSYLYLLEPATVSPATSAAWTDTELNGAEFGYELVS